MKGLEKLNYPQLVKVLGQEEHISGEVLEESLRESKETGVPLSEILVRDGIASEWDLARIISREFSLPILIPTNYEIDKDIIGLIESDMVWRTGVIPLDRFGKILSVAMPLFVSFSVLEEIRSHTGLEIFPFVAPTTEVQRIIEKNWERRGPLEMPEGIEHQPQECAPAAVSESGEPKEEPLPALEKESPKAPLSSSSEGEGMGEEWQKLFDEADEDIKKDGPF